MGGFYVVDNAQNEERACQRFTPPSQAVIAVVIIINYYRRSTVILSKSKLWHETAYILDSKRSDRIQSFSDCYYCMVKNLKFPHDEYNGVL